jgi:hypothetical protein
MMVYREQRKRVRTAEVLQHIGESRGFERQIEMGELHAGIADALCPDCDRDIRNAALPPEIEVSVPEGFAYYALDPELYRIAARRFVEDVHPQSVAVIGIRSIGTTLGAIVEAEFRSLGLTTRFATVRPRGHPFHRTVCVDYDLAHPWLGWSGHFAIVDEGPGLSGSSFASVAEFLGTLGIRDDRIVFLPGWNADGSTFNSEDARRRWQRHRRYTAGFEELNLFNDAVDLSAGKWRDLRGVWPPVQALHERRKYLRGNRLYKFAGYGRYGREKLERAARLAGFVPPALGLEEGFLVTQWVDGRAVRVTRPFIEHMAKYLAHIAREFATGEPAGTATLARMIEVNTGRLWTGPIPESRAVALDARMFPHEWLETAGGYVKTDALDHYDDHFFPGPQDIAWDLAGCAVEFGAGPELVESYTRESGDRGAAARLPFYRAAYLAFRLGYCDMAAQALDPADPDAERFRNARERYDTLIRSEPWTTTISRLSA